jgi:hypothetical protein
MCTTFINIRRLVILPAHYIHAFLMVITINNIISQRKLTDLSLYIWRLCLMWDKKRIIMCCSHQLQNRKISTNQTFKIRHKQQALQLLAHFEIYSFCKSFVNTNTSSLLRWTQVGFHFLFLTQTLHKICTLPEHHDIFLLLIIHWVYVASCFLFFFTS